MALADSVPLSLSVALIISYATTPQVIALADRWQFYDRPAGYKGHAQPTPYLGGAAVMAGFVCSMLLTAGIDWRRTVPVLGGVVLLWIVGTVDDRRTVSPAVRVLVELALGLIVWAVGLGWHLRIGSGPDLVFTCVWIVAVVNAFNLFDNMDGAATTMAFVVSAGAATLGILGDDTWLAVAAAALGGACLGFLPRNLARPARIFLGDGGSMPLGFAVAVLAIDGAAASPAPWKAVVIGVLLVGIPALDTCLVVVSRRRRGISVLTGGRDHLTHRVRLFLPGTRAVALTLGVVQAGVCGLGVLVSENGSEFAVFSAVLYLSAAGSAIWLLDNRLPDGLSPVGHAAWYAGPRSPALGRGRAPASDRELHDAPTPPLEGPHDSGRALRGNSTASGSLGSSSPGRDGLALGVIAVLGLGAGLSPFVAAYYDATTWVPIGLAIVGAAAIGLIARPGRVVGPGALALSGLVGIGVWSLVSAAWAQSVEGALVDGNRMLVYGALVALLLIVLRTRLRATWLLTTLGGGVLAVALSVLVRLLAGDPGSLFLAGRLNSPVGYINGEGCLFVMGFWLCWAVAEYRRPWVAGAGAGSATLMACLALLSQSRGTALAMLVSTVAVVATAPGARRRLVGLGFVALGVAAARAPLLAIYRQGAGGSLASSVAHAAGRATLLAALVVGASWAGVIVARNRVVAGDPVLAARLRRVGSTALVLVALAGIVAAGASAARIERSAKSQWQAFTHLSSPAGASVAAGQSRLLSGVGNRYDYWRVAWNVWRANPILGIGAGNYARPYYQERATTEDVDQPHSLELQTLAELGLVGAGLLVAVLCGVLLGARRLRRNARASLVERGLLVAALGTSSAWFTQTSGDWIHLLPGITAVALGALAVLVSRPDGDFWDSGRRPRQRVRTLAVAPARVDYRRAARVAGGVAVAGTLVIAGASLTRQGLSDYFRASAQAELATNPAGALTQANRSLRVDPYVVDTYYVAAAALARLDEPAAADAALRAALRREPSNFVTWTLRGDIAVRRGDFGSAKTDYGTARRLNPRDLTLRALAADPRGALR